MLINLNQSLLIYHRMFYYDYLCNYVSQTLLLALVIQIEVGFK